MKTLALTLLIVLSITYSFAQTWENTTGGIYYNGGNVGIGTGTPMAPLHLNGNMNIPFTFTLAESSWDRPIIHTDWAEEGGDFIAIKHGGNNAESGTYGIRIGDHYGFEFGRDNFSVNLFSIDKLGRVGIGTTNPLGKLTVSGGDLVIDHPQDKYYVGLPSLSLLDNAVIFKHNNGDKAAEIRGAVPPGKHTTGIVFRTKATWSDPYVNQVYIHPEGDVGIGTTSPDAKLTVKGDIHAEEVRVDLNVPGPDYVFEEDYDLPTLEKVQDYIRENKHLLEVPSAQEMETNGIDLGVMNMLLLKKVEELTLHLIEQDNRVKKLEFENQKIRSMLEDR